MTTARLGALKTRSLVGELLFDASKPITASRCAVTFRTNPIARPFAVVLLTRFWHWQELVQA
jgi:hypothetical protein